MSDEFFSAPSPTSGATSNPPVWELSGWWRRAGGYFIDGLVIGIPLAVLSEIIRGAAGLSEDADSGVSFLLLTVGTAIYYMWTMTAWNGQTVGKRVTGIRVVREDGGQMTPAYAFKRQTLVITLLFGWAAILLLYIPTFLNYLWPLWDEKNQALHDKIVKSRVVRAEPSTDPATIQVAAQAQSQVQGQAPFPVSQPAAPTSPAPPAAPAPPTPSAPPAPPTPSGTSTPYTPPPGFENPVPEEDEK